MPSIPKPGPRARRTIRATTIIGAGALASLGAAAAGTAIVARTVTRRDEKHPDPYREVPYGTLPGGEPFAFAAEDGTKLHAVRAGDAGGTLFFTHGFSLNSGTWYHQFDDFRHDHRLVAWDVRGHGGSSPTESDYALETMAGDLARLIELETETDEPIVLIGHSMGGMITVQLLVLYPELLASGKVRGVVLADTGMGDIIGGLFRFGTPAIRAAVRPLIELGYTRIARDPRHLDRLRGRGTDLHYAWARLMGFGPRPSHRHVRFVREMLDGVETDVWVRMLPSIIEMELRSHLERIDVPVMLTVGTHDRITPPTVARMLEEAFPNGNLVMIEDAGHTPMLEKPDVWNAALRDFLSRLG